MVSGQKKWELNYIIFIWRVYFRTQSASQWDIYSKRDKLEKKRKWKSFHFTVDMLWSSAWYCQDWTLWLGNRGEYEWVDYSRPPFPPRWGTTTTNKSPAWSTVRHGVLVKANETLGERERNNNDRAHAKGISLRTEHILRYYTMKSCGAYRN